MIVGELYSVGYAVKFMDTFSFTCDSVHNHTRSNHIYIYSKIRNNQPSQDHIQRVEHFTQERLVDTEGGW